MTVQSFWRLHRPTLRSYVLFVAMLLVLSVVATFIHELGHIITAYIVGQPIKSIDLLDNVVLRGSPPPLSEAVINFSGGLFSALVLGVSYIGLSKKANGHSLFWLGIPLLFFSVFEVGNGLIEGLAKVQYIEMKLFFPWLEYVVIAGLVTISFAVSIGEYYFRVRRPQGAQI